MEDNNNELSLDADVSHSLGKHHITYEYLGEGGFGMVTKCLNKKTDTKEAVKINHNNPESIHQAKLEIAMLKRLRCLDPDTCNIIRWNEFFFHRDMICLSFELLDLSLRDFMINRENAPLPMSELRPIIHQTVTALFHLSSISLVHADFKPENIMIVNRFETPLKVKLIDFGLAHPAFSAQPDDCVQTTCYRAPEVMLRIPFGEAIDMWSVGVTVAELATGHLLYPGNMDYDMLRFIIDTQGQPADHVLDRGEGTSYYFHWQTSGESHWRLKTCQEFEMETGYCSDNTQVIRFKSLDELKAAMQPKGNEAEHLQLMDLIKKMLDLDPDTRIKAKDVLKHEFITEKPPKSSPASKPKDKQVAEPQDVNVASSTSSQDESDKRTENVQQKTKSKRCGLFKAVGRWLSRTCHRLFPCVKKRKSNV